MLAGTEKGRCYSAGEMKQWLTKTGFKNIVIKNLPETIFLEGKLKD
jgi:hypothetical protein